MQAIVGTRPHARGRTLACAWLLSLLALPAAAMHQVVVLEAPPAAHRIAAAREAGQPLDVAAIQAYRAELWAAQDAFLQQLAARGIAFTQATVSIPDLDGNVLQQPLRYTLVHNAIAIDVADSAVPAIEAMPGVRAVHEDRWYDIRLDRSVAYTRAPGVYGAVHELTAFDDFREGLEGQGINIAIIDTGIEWSHEQFGGDPTPPRYGTNPAAAAVATNPKVIYYLSLMENVVDEYGHGTHVAATAAGYLGHAPGADGIPLTADDVPLHGVAPQARLMGYKVCSGVGSASATVGCLGTSIQLALEDAVSPVTLTGFAKPVAHVINMSLGGAGTPDDLSSEGADNAVRAGAIVVAAGGNAGPGQNTLDSPGMSRRSIQVAAHNDPGVFPNSLEVENSTHGKIVVYQAPDSNLGMPMVAPIAGRYVFAGFADTPDQVPLTVAGNICLVERGSTAEAADNGTGLFANKAANCEAKGAIATLVYNDVPGEIGAGVLAPSTRPVLTASRDTGLLLQDLGFDATGASLQRIVLGPPDPSLFAPGIAAFSSRGPVPRLGQVKPDLAAPGVDVLAATTPVGPPVVSMADPTRYVAANGTSMATPHVAGAAALLKQAHPGWGADLVRAALMNTSSNGRSASGVPLPDGPQADDIISQGAGLVDVAAAAGVQVLMGVAGDGLVQPALLASHSFGAVPVIDSRVTHASTVTVELRDVSGQGGSYALSVAENRDLDLAGIAASVTPASVTVPPGGSASATLSLSVDGDLLRDIVRGHPDGSQTRLQLQGYLLAQRSGGDTLRMPFFLLPERSMPAGANGSVSERITGLMPAADAGAQLVPGVTYVDHPIAVREGAFRLSALLSFADLAGGIPDLDLFLLDPDGNAVTSSASAGGPEQLSHVLDRGGTWTLRVNGWANGPTDYTLDVTQELGGQPPALQPFVEEGSTPEGMAVSFDGEVMLHWTPAGGELGYEVYRAMDGGAFEVVAELDDGTATGLLLEEQPAGVLAFYVRGIHTGRIGFYVTPPSVTQEVWVDPRRARDITAKTDATISNVRFAGGVFEFDLALTNGYDNSWHPALEFDIRKIKSGSGTVKAINADNGGSGTSPQDPARYSYSAQLGADGVFTPGETSGVRHLRFDDPRGELFTFKAKITAHERQGSTAPPPADSGGDGAAPDPGDDPLSILSFTVNPLLGTVLVELLPDL